MAREKHPAAVEMGLRLRSLREELGLSRLEVSAQLGLTEEGYAHYERGFARIILTELPKMAAALGVSNRALLMRLGLLPMELPAESGNAEMADDELGRQLAPLLESWPDANERGRSLSATLLRSAVEVLRQSSYSANYDKRLAMTKGGQSRPLLALAR